MLVKSLDGKEFKITASSQTDKKKSKLHLLAISKLKTISGMTFFTEVLIEPIFRKKLYLDIFIPLAKIVIEVNGKQHYNYISHFHSSKSAWSKSISNDQIKRDWCKHNDFLLLELKFDETKKWEEQIKNAIKSKLGKII